MDKREQILAATAAVIAEYGLESAPWQNRQGRQCRRGHDLSLFHHQRSAD